jgi:hypothetical protein
MGLASLGASAQSVVDPADDVAGKSQYEWTANWWTFVGKADNSTNPLFSSNGPESLDLINEAGSPVYFLTGHADAGPIDRTVHIGTNQHILFPG